MKRLNDRTAVTVRGAAFVISLALAALPLTAAAACTGKYAAMQSYVVKPSKTPFLDLSPVAARLRELPVELRYRLKRNAGGADLVGCELVASGAVQRHTSETGAIVVFDLATGTVTAAVHGRGSIDVYLIKDPASGPTKGSWSDVPAVVRDWAIMADMGFPSQQPRSVRLHPPAG